MGKDSLKSGNTSSFHENILSLQPLMPEHQRIISLTNQNSQIEVTTNWCFNSTVATIVVNDLPTTTTTKSYPTKWSQLHRPNYTIMFYHKP